MFVGDASGMWGSRLDELVSHVSPLVLSALSLSKYEVLERGMLPKIEALKQKLPELRKTLRMIEFLRKKQVRVLRCAMSSVR